MLWMPPMAHVLEVERRYGITGREEAIVRLGDIGIVEHVIHELAHAVLLDLVIDDETFFLSAAVASEISDRGRLQQSDRVPALYEVDAIAAESLVIEQLGLPIKFIELQDALEIQAGPTLNGEHLDRLNEARDTGHVIDAAKRVCSIVAPMGRGDAREGVAFVRLDKDGFEIGVIQMMLGNARLYIGEPGSETILNAWCYQSDALGDAMQKAIAGAAEWDGEGDDPPGGWYRNPQSGRRRPGGFREKEFVHW